MHSLLMVVLWVDFPWFLLMLMLNSTLSQLLHGCSFQCVVYHYVSYRRVFPYAFSVVIDTLPDTCLFRIYAHLGI